MHLKSLFFDTFKYLYKKNKNLPENSNIIIEPNWYRKLKFWVIKTKKIENFIFQGFKLIGNLIKYYRHFKNLIQLNLKLIRNSTITERLNSGYDNLSYDLLDFITEDGPNYYKRIGIGPLNNQHLRQRLTEDLLKRFKPKFIIETGTFLGDSTEFFGKFSKVFSIEKSKLFYFLSKSRFYNEKQIQIIHGKSEVELRKIKNFNDNTFFYLDAHWGEDLPLKVELEQITSNYVNYIICIDDFEVPNDSSWGFDSYAGVKLDINLLEGLENTKIYFPNYSASLESGEKRGTVFLTNSNDQDYIFEKNNFKLYDIK